MTVATKKKASAKADSKADSNSSGDSWLELFAIFVHDLESPFASQKYLLKILKEGRLDLTNEKHQNLITSCQVAIERAESILYDIMAVARAGKVGLPVSMKTIVPDAVIQEAIVMAGGAAAENQIDITFTNNATGIPVQADPKLLKRVLDNLLYNAIRHTPANSNISIYTEPAEKSVFIHIKDSGPGLGDADTSQMFEKFGQLELRASSDHRGVGLGLYFCKLAATGMGGTILVDDHPKGGAVFSIKLNKGKG